MVLLFFFNHPGEPAGSVWFSSTSTSPALVLSLLILNKLIVCWFSFLFWRMNMENKGGRVPDHFSLWDLSLWNGGGARPWIWVGFTVVSFAGNGL